MGHKETGDPVELEVIEGSIEGTREEERAGDTEEAQARAEPDCEGVRMPRCCERTLREPG